MLADNAQVAPLDLDVPVKMPCRQTIWRRKKRAAAQLALLERNPTQDMEEVASQQEGQIMEVRAELLEIEGPGGDEQDIEEWEGGELSGEISVEEDEYEMEEDDQEEGEEEQRGQDEGEEDQFAEAVRSWPVLS